LGGAFNRESREEVFPGRSITAADIGLIRGLLEDTPDWNRSRLSRELCERWAWRNGKGRLKDMAARTLLLKLEPPLLPRHAHCAPIPWQTERAYPAPPGARSVCQSTPLPEGLNFLLAPPVGIRYSMQYVLKLANIGP
jgi:hypothetical protein